MTNKVSLSVASIVAIVSVVGIIWLYSQQSTTLLVGETTAQIWIESPILITPQQTYEVIWESQNLDAIYLNDGGTVGAYQRTFAYDVCETPRFAIDARDGNTYNLTVSPLLITHPLILCVAFLFLIALLVIIKPLDIPLLSTLGNKLRPLFKILDTSYWQNSWIIWLGIIFFGLTVFIGFLFFGATCNEEPIGLIGSHFIESQIAIALSGCIALVGLIVCIVKPSIIKQFAKLLQYFPYPVIISAIFIYWALAYNYLMILGTLVDPLLVIPTTTLIFALGIAVMAGRLCITSPVTPTKLSKNVPISRISPVTLSVGATLLWLVIYQTNWLTFINNDVVQTAIACLLYLLPGVLFALLTVPELKHWTTLITYGLLSSLAMLAIIWVPTMFLGLSADHLQWIYTLIGLVLLLLVIWRKPQHQLFQLQHQSTVPQTIVLGLSFIAMFIILALITEPGFGHIDGDFRQYNPLVMRYAQSSQLTFLDPYLGTDNLMNYRLWFTFLTVPQGLIVSWSGVHIMVNFHIIAVGLGLFVFIVNYDVSRRLTSSGYLALMAILFLAYFLVTHQEINQFGSRFFRSIVQDKYIAAFILSPILVTLTVEFLREPTKKRLFWVALALMVTMLGHSITYIFTCIVIGITTVVFVLFNSRRWSHIIIIALLAGLWMIPPLMARVASIPSDVDYVTDADSYTEIYGADVSYSPLDANGEIRGINPALLSTEIYILLGLAILLTVIFPRRSRNGYIAVAYVTLLALLMIPPTTKLIGLIVTLGQIWRYLWVIPYGIVAVFILYELKLLWQHNITQRYHFAQWSLVILASALLYQTFLVAIPNPDQPQGNQVNIGLRERFDNKRESINTGLMLRYQNLADVGDYIQQQSDAHVVVAADRPFEYLIPSLNATSFAMDWYRHTSSNISLEDLEERQQVRKQIFDDDLTVQEFEDYVTQYNVDYILYENQPEHLKDIVKESRFTAESIKFGTLTLWRITSDDISS